MHAKKQSLPEAYLELQIERSRSFFVCPGDMGILRRVENTLNSVDNERKREEKLARREKERTAAAAAGFGSANGTRSRASSVSGPSSSAVNHNQNEHSTSNAAPGGDVLSKWTNWSGPWRGGSASLSSASGAAAHLDGSVSAHPALMAPTTSHTATGLGPKALPPLTRARALTSPVSLPSRIDHSTWFMDPRFDGSFPSRVLPYLYLGNL